MKVKDLIKDSIWRPGKLCDPKVKPAISVLLPTFRRGKSGLFRRAVQSVLDQTLEDIELIIIDDASSDGTADQIKDFMQKDGRISVITHPRNVGLPAISEYEGFLRARADYFAFAFDDDLFYPDALEQLLDHSRQNPGKVCYGRVLMRVREPGSPTEQLIPCGQDITSWNIRSGNPLSNNAMLLPRSVIEDVGFYDPRVVMARQCDWDLWRRIGDKYLLHYVDVDIGEVDGPVTNDSLGHTYLLDSWTSEALMRSDRSKELRPDALGECDLEIAPGCEAGSLSRAINHELTSGYLADRPWLGNTRAKPSGVDGSILVLTHSHDASTSLCFDNLPKAIASKVRVINFRGPFGPSELARASCLVLVRFVEMYDEWLKLAKLMNIPVYYFLDDNFPELIAKEKYNFAEDFSRGSLGTRLREFDGVLLSSKTLVDYFETHLMHPKIFFFPPCYIGNPITLPPTLKENKRPLRSKQEGAAKGSAGQDHLSMTADTKFDLTAAFAGGLHRRTGLTESVMPALLRLADDGVSIHLIVGGCSGDAEETLRKLDGEGLKITCLPLELDWKRALIQLAQYEPDILIHGPSSTVNNRYKTLNAALNAYLLDAVLVAPDHAPFDDPAFSNAAMLVRPPDQAKAWLAVLSKILSDRPSWKRYKIADAEYCKTHFSGDANVSALRSMLQAAPPVGFATVESRLKMLFLEKTKEVAAANSASDLPALNTSLTELAQMRKSHRRYRNLRFLFGRDDLWPSVSPTFEDIRAYLLDQGVRRRGMKLELSDSLHDRDHAEYRLSLPPGTLRSVSCGFASEGIHKGIVGLDISSSDGTILLREEFDMSALNLHMPVCFDAGLKIPNHSDFRLRLFARTDWPLYILELVSYRGLQRRPVAPFARFDYAEDS